MTAAEDTTELREKCESLLCTLEMVVGARVANRGPQFNALYYEWSNSLGALMETTTPEDHQQAAIACKATLSALVKALTPTDQP